MNWFGNNMELIQEFTQLIQPESEDEDEEEEKKEDAQKEEEKAEEPPAAPVETPQLDAKKTP